MKKTPIAKIERPFKSTFQPSRWWRNPHLQTIWPVVVKPRSKPKLQRQRVELADGDFIDLDWLKKPAADEAILLILHGLEGNANSHYARRILQQAQTQNKTAVLMNQRSCSGEPNRLPRTYHSGETDDLTHILKQLRHQYPENPIEAVGYSLGGNMLAKYLGEQGEHSEISRAVIVSAPLDLAACAVHINQGFSKIYQHHLIRKLHRKYKQKLATPIANQLPFTVKELRRCNTFHLFDDSITAPLHGFQDSFDYYQKSSGKSYLTGIKIPTLILHATDDPFMNESVTPTSESISSCVQLELPPYGGHLGFIEGGWPWAPRFYVDKCIMNFFNT